MSFRDLTECATHLRILRASWGTTARSARAKLIARAGCLSSALLLGSVIVPASPGRAQTPAATPLVDATRREYQVRYAYLYSFALMTKWPETAFEATGGDFVIAVAGDPPYRADLEHVAKTKKAQNRPIKIAPFDADAATPACQLLYVPDSVPAPRRDALLKQLRGKPVLLVGDAEGFALAGGVARFFLEDDNIRFELNPTAAAAQQLAVDPRMTKLAKVVGQEKAAASAATPSNAGGN